MPRDGDNEILDYAVVGGGVAGTYLAWRLASARPTASVAVLESTERIGGRLFTLPMPGTTFNSELGGMRYTSRHTLVRSLVRELGLTELPFQFETKHFYLRGVHFKSGDASTAIPYALQDWENRCEGNPFSLVLDALIQCLRGVEFGSLSNTETADLVGKLPDLPLGSVPQLSPREWRLIKQRGVFRSIPVNEIGFWNLLQSILSSEGFLFVHDGLGYESVVTNWNAAEALQWFLADFVAEYFTLAKGMNAIPEELAALAHQAGVDIVFNCRLARVDQISRSVFKLGCDVADMDSSKTTRTNRVARNVVLALPQAPLRRLDLKVENYDHYAWSTLLDSVTGHGMFKLFLAYNEAWWAHDEAIGAETGRTVTDLPIRQVYYFSPQVAGGPAVVMASYSDEHYVDFWRPIVKQPSHDFFYTGEVPLADVERATLESFGVTERMVQKVQRQLGQVHPRVTIPAPYAGLAKDWSARPHRGCWHSWNPGASSRDVIEQMRQPFGSNLFVCGEAYSCEQAWVEGALRSAEIVLRLLGVDPPEWVTPDKFQAFGYDDCDSYALGGPD